jgi:hypothetical protein
MKTQETKKTLENFCKTHGLPLTVGSTGWSQQECYYTVNDVQIGTSEESSKGWLYVNMTEDDDSSDEDPTNYSNFEELWQVISSFLWSNTSETYLQVTYGENDYVISLHDRDMTGKSWDFKAEDDVEIYKFIREYLITQGVEHIPEDDQDLDINEFLSEYADPNWGDSQYDFFDSYALLEFEDGTTVMLEKDNDSNLIYVSRVNNNDVDPANPF